MARIYLIRHGQTDWNVENRTQGCGNDLPLSVIGRVQARSVSHRFINVPVDAIYSSDLKRATETASEISSIVLKPVITMSDLREMNFGCWEGLTTTDIRTQYKELYAIWKSNPKEAVIPDGETLIMLQKRVIRAVNEIISAHNGKNIIIVSHGITIKVIILSMLGMDLSYHSNLKLDNTGITLVEHSDERSRLAMFNDTCHLNGEVVL